MSIVTAITSLLTNTKHLNLIEELFEEEKEIVHELREEIELLEHKCKHHESPYLRVGFNDITILTKGNIKMAFNLKDTQEVALTATVVDSKGNPASTASVGTWASSDTAVVVVTAADDGKSAVAAATGALGSAKVTFAVDGVTAEFDITIVGGAVALASITAGDVTDVPAPTPAPTPAPEPDPVPATPVA